MVLEVALLDVRDGTQADFRAGYATAKQLLDASEGLQSIRMTQGVETPTRFVLLVEWDSLEAHQAFRDSDRFAQWRELIGPFFDGAPHVEHFVDVD